MFQYYTTVTSLSLLLMLILLAILYSDEILRAYERRGFFIAFCLLMFELMLEWAVNYLSVNNLGYSFLYKFGIATLFCVGPSINLILAWLVYGKKGNRFVKIFTCLVVLNIIIPYSALFGDHFIYFYDSTKFKFGEYFWILVVLALASCVFLFVSIYKTSKRYQARNSYILVLVLIQFMVGFYIQFKTSSVFVLWIDSVLVFAFLYIYYSTLINQMDVLTGLLNRRSYENQVYDIRSEAIILILDVNKFKNINDTLGHAYGDLCLSEIGKALKKVYAHSGNCYRIGGDEFCVILTKNLDKVDEFNYQLKKVLRESKCQHGLPTVSAGYATFTPNVSAVQKTIEDADEMMYEEKSKSKSID